MILPLALILCFMVGCQDKEAMAELEAFKAQAEIEAQNIELMNRYIEAVNKKKSSDVVDEFFSPDYVWHCAGEDVSFSEGKKRYGATFSNFPDFRVKAEDMISAGDKVIVRWTVSGTHKETGEKLSLALITIDRIVGDKFVEGWEIKEKKAIWNSFLDAELNIRYWGYLSRGYHKMHL